MKALQSYRKGESSDLFLFSSILPSEQFSFFEKAFLPKITEYLTYVSFLDLNTYELNFGLIFLIEANL